MTQNEMTWEQAVQWLRGQPEQRELVRACFFDDPLIDAARRYRDCAEWTAARALLPAPPGRVLDLGSGRGIASYALAADGWNVTALEPDPSELVGSGAVRALAAEAGLDIEVVEEFGERLPFPEASFDAVHARQVLHHARDLDALCRELGRVLRPGGTLLATREHVVTRASDVPDFQALHPLHQLYGGENAFTLARYTGAITDGGVRLTHVLSPWASDINLFPASLDDARQGLARKLRWPWPGLIPAWVMARLGHRLNTPGRLYTFRGVRA